MSASATRPAVSVLMAVYNGERFLREAVESVLSQTWRDFEFIILDDGSTDGTAAILDGIADARIVRLRNAENLGLAPSLNAGLEAARGELVARMDADDISLPERLAQEVSFLNAHPDVGLVSGNCRLMDSKAAVVSPPLFPKNYEDVEVEWELFWGNPIVHPTVMFRASIVKACGGYPRGYRFYAEDYALWFRMVRRTRIAVLSQILLHLRKHERNATVTVRDSHIKEVLGVVQSALAQRIGYRPSSESLCMIRGWPADEPRSETTPRAARRLLVDAYLAIAARAAAQGRQSNVREDAERRLERLVPREPGRRDALAVFGALFRVNREKALAPARLKELVRGLLGRRLSLWINGLRRHFGLLRGSDQA